MKSNDGGPAFPRPISTDYAPEPCNVAYDFRGMTLRQYYKAHAPPAPAWFSPDMTKYPPLPSEPDLDAIGDENDRRNASQWVVDPIWELEETHPQLAWFVNAYRERAEAEMQLDEYRLRERVMQWPGFWADMMLAEDAEHLDPSVETQP